MIALTVDSKIDVVASLALVLGIINSIAALGWWRQGPRLKISVNTGMVIIGNGTEKDNLYFAFSVTNVGSAVTTINNFGIAQYHTRSGKQQTSLWVANYTGPQTPHLLPVGHNMSCHMLQSDALSERLKKGKNYFEVYHSFSKKPTRVKIPCYKPYVRPH